MLIDLATLNAASPGDFAAALDGVFEHAPWVAERAAPGRPFADFAALHAALLDQLATVPEAELSGFLNGHPELAADRLPTGLTAHSQAEQAGLGMAGVAGGADVTALNRAYRARFGWPFIICVARHTGADVLRQLRLRLDRDEAAERRAALTEIGHITRLRLAARIADAPACSGSLTLRVLDSVTGGPALGVDVRLLQEEQEVARATTDAEGNATGWLPPGALRQGEYEFAVDAAGYFARSGTATSRGIVTMRFRITEPERLLHIALLLDPASAANAATEPLPLA